MELSTGRPIEVATLPEECRRAEGLSLSVEERFLVLRRVSRPSRHKAYCRGDWSNMARARHAFSGEESIVFCLVSTVFTLYLSRQDLASR